MNDNEPAAPLGGGGLASLIRLRLDLGYDGTALSGWAMQPRKRTVEAELSAALTLILRASRPVRLIVAGRTDALHSASLPLPQLRPATGPGSGAPPRHGGE